MARLVWMEEQLPLPGSALHVRILPGEGPALLLFHGLGVDGTVWQGVARRLTPAFTLIAPDLRGHGASDHPAAGYTAEDYAADAAALVERLVPRFGQLAVLGHSLGAVSALGAAIRRPDGVGHLILSDPPGDATPLGPYLAAVLAAKQEGEAALRSVVRRYQPELGDLIGDVQVAMWQRTADGVLRAILDEPAQVFGVDAWYDRVAAPTLLLAADHTLDARLRPERAAVLLQRLRQGTFVEVQGAGHVIHAQQPAEFARLVREFMRA